MFQKIKNVCYNLGRIGADFMARKSKKAILKEQKVTIKELFVAYTFLLCATVIFLYSVRNMTIRYDNIEINFMSLLFPIVFFLSNITAKELGYKYGGGAIVISSITLFFYGAFSNFFMTANFQVFDMAMLTMSYFITQSICLAIYYYFLVNTRLPIFIVICNYILSSLIYNMLYMALVNNMVATKEFWLEYLLLILFQGILSIVLAIFDCFVERGID